MCREYKSMNCKNRLRSRHLAGAGAACPQASNFCMRLGRSAFGRYRQLKLVVSRHGRGTDATKCGLDVLALHCRDHVRRCKIVGGQSVGLGPPAAADNQAARFAVRRADAPK